jgi:hypothetical protein
MSRKYRAGGGREAPVAFGVSRAVSAAISQAGSGQGTSPRHGATHASGGPHLHIAGEHGYFPRIPYMAISKSCLSYLSQTGFPKAGTTARTREARDVPNVKSRKSGQFFKARSCRVIPVYGRSFLNFCPSNFRETGFGNRHIGVAWEMPRRLPPASGSRPSTSRRAESNLPGFPRAP